MPESDEVKVAPNTLTDADISNEIAKMDLPANSHKYNAENSDRRLKKVIQGNAVTRKKSFGRKLGETFLAEDVSNVKNYLLFDVIIPAVKDTIVNVVTNGISAFVYGDTKSRPTRFGAKSYGYGGSNYTSYSSVSRNRPPEGSFRAGRDYGDPMGNDKEPIVELKSDAEYVLDGLSECIDRFDQATVGDLYDLLGFDSSHTDYKWGWVDLSTATVRKVSDGWLIDLPRPGRL